MNQQAPSINFGSIGQPTPQTSVNPNASSIKPLIQNVGLPSQSAGLPVVNTPQYPNVVTTPSSVNFNANPTGLTTPQSVQPINFSGINSQASVAPVGGNPVSTQQSVVNANAQRVAQAQASAAQYSASIPNGGQNNQNGPDLSGLSTTSNASDLSQGNSYADLLAAIGQNQENYLNTAQQSQSELDAQNSYLQAVQNSQNLQLSLTGGELGQYGTGRPLSLDTGRAAQLGFNDQLAVQGAQNQATIAGQELGFEQNARSIRTQAASTALQSALSIGGLAKPSVSGNALVSPTGQVQNLGGVTDPAQITNLATSIFQNGAAPDFATAYSQAQQILSSTGTNQANKLSPTQQTSLQNNGSTTATMTPNNIMGYDLSSYASNPQYEQEITGQIQNMPQQMTTPSQIQSYISQNYPNSPITGQMIFNASSSSGVSTKVLSGILAQESQMGTDGSVGAKGNNPGNWGNTDSAMANGQPVNFPTLQDGVNHVADWLAQHPAQQQTSPQQETYQNVQQILPAPLSGSLNVLSDGTPYLQLSKVPSQNQQLANVYAQKYGIPLLNDDQVSKVQNIDTLTQKINQMVPLISQTLGSGLGGKISNTVGTWVNSLTGGNQGINQLNSYNTAAISAIENIVGGSGSGVRVTGAEIGLAQSLVPNSTDTLEQAQTKLASLQSQINEWRNEYFSGQPIPSTFGQIQSQITGQSAQPQQVQYQGQTYNVDAQGNMTQT